MDEKKKEVPDFGYVEFDKEKPDNLPMPKVVKCGTKTRSGGFAIRPPEYKDL